MAVSFTASVESEQHAGGVNPSTTRRPAHSGQENKHATDPHPASEADADPHPDPANATEGLTVLATILAGVGCAGALLRSAADNCRFAMALALTELWVVATLAYMIDGLVLLPVLDLMLALAVLWIRHDFTDQRWLDALLVLMGIRLALHVLFGFGALDFNIMAHGLNATFAGALAIVATSRGERDGARRRIGVLLRRIRGDRGGTHPATAAEA